MHVMYVPGLSLLAGVENQDYPSKPSTLFPSRCLQMAIVLWGKEAADVPLSEVCNDPFSTRTTLASFQEQLWGVC